MGRTFTMLGISLALLTTVLAGCAEDAGPDAETGEGEPGAVIATDTTGGIRGVVVDTSIVPISGANILVTPGDATAQTDENGNFVVSGLEEGTYFVDVQHPLYEGAKQNAEVVAGVAEPKPLKFQLVRVVTIEPYVATQAFKGYITCSANIVVALSEECGEGVGLPGQGRVGKNSNNQAQIDFNIEGPFVETIIAEAVWEPSLSVAAGGTQQGAFNMGIYVDFSCEPSCGWANQIDRRDSVSPMYLRNDYDAGDGSDYNGDTSLQNLTITPDMQFSTFTWAAADETGVLLEQPFDVYITTSHGLPLPEGWSFVNNDPAPF